MWQAEVEYTDGVSESFEDVDPISKVDGLVLIMVYNGGKSIAIIPVSQIRHARIFEVKG